VETPTIYKKTIMQISQKHFCCQKNADVPYLLQTAALCKNYLYPLFIKWLFREKTNEKDFYSAGTVYF
jgi:hypothetical protein